MTIKEKLQAESLQELRKIKSSIQNIENQVSDEDFDEICLSLESSEFYLKLFEIDRCLDEIRNTLMILKRYSDENLGI